MKTEIGGYFELELPKGQAMYSDLIGLNSARNALVLLIKSKKITKIHLPYFNCRVVSAAVERHCPETSILYYHIDAGFNPDLTGIDTSAFLYYINYFGLQELILQRLENVNLIVDNAQAFYSPPRGRGHTIYCPRKFFGVCDGGYLQTDTESDLTLVSDTSWERGAHLMKRIDCGASPAYFQYQAAEAALAEAPPMKMSRLTRRILAGIDYPAIKAARIDNFMHLHLRLGAGNMLSSSIETALTTDSFVPFCYPYLTEGAELLRKQLLANEIYVPVYWPELAGDPELNAFERRFVEQIVCLPIDQRYGKAEMLRMADRIAR
jgi:hypothetical protein